MRTLCGMYASETPRLYSREHLVGGILVDVRGVSSDAADIVSQALDKDLQ